MLEVNTILQKRYRIVRPLGQGGMATVYEAIDERIDKTVAIKQILFELENTSNGKHNAFIKKAFRREASSLVKARHEVVPDVTDFFAELESLFFVMEFIEGDDFSKTLKKRKRPFRVEDVSLWIDDLLDALDYLHNLDPPIIHRDIKPQNLKINERHKIKLLDFGIAKSTDKNSTYTQHTFIGATLNYSPIEQILRVIDPTFREYILLKHKDKATKFLKQNTGPLCDIFSLGATFYQLLTGKPPIDITKRALEIWEGRNDPLTMPSELNPDITQKVSEWLLKSLAFERQDRFVSAIEMRKSWRLALAEDVFKTKNAHLAIGQKNREETEQEIRDREKVLMQAKTERLIEINEPQALSVEDPLKTFTPLGEVSESRLSEIFSFDGDAGASNYTFSNTDVSMVDLSDNSTTPAFVDVDFQSAEKGFKSEETEFRIPSKVEIKKPEADQLRNILALPIILILAIVVLGGTVFGVIGWINYSKVSPENKSAVAIEDSNKIETDNSNLSVQQNLNIKSETNSVIDMGTNSANDMTVNSKDEKTAKTVRSNKAAETAKPTKENAENIPTKNSTEIKQTKNSNARTNPKTNQTTKKPKDPSCIYTNSC
jgi:serine/threonine protein kinase